jgi:ferredoxin
MVDIEAVDLADLQQWLEHVERKESAERLMLAIARKQGITVRELADWYDRPPEEIRAWFERLEEEPIASAIAESEGISIELLADEYGVSSTTIRNWLRDLASEPVEDAVDVLGRYSRRQSAPQLQRTRSRVTFLDYEAIDARDGWSVDDEDLFEKASDADLSPEEHGRIVVEPGETILEGAEKRGFEWPYACRGGACANCAVMVRSGDIAMPGNNVLSDEQVNTLNARLTCVGVPVTEDVEVITNVQHLDQFADLRLPSPFDTLE